MIQFSPAVMVVLQLLRLKAPTVTLTATQHDPLQTLSGSSTTVTAATTAKYYD